MPALTQIELFLGGNYPIEESKNFTLKSRCICNYLERALKEEKHQTTLSRVNIFCSKEIDKAKAVRLKKPPFLEASIKYDLPTLSELNESSLQAHFIRIIDSGLAIAQTFMPIPHEYCMNALRQFENGGFKNEWIQTQKIWKQLAIHCDVLAQLTTEKFSLQQLIYRDGLLVEKKQIAETKPREMLFYDYFGTLSLDKSETIVYRNKEKVLTRFSIKTNKFYDPDSSKS